MFDIKRETAPANGETVIPSPPGFHLLSFSLRDDKKISRENITAGITTRPIVAFAVRDGAAHPVTFPSMPAGDISATLLPGGAIIEGDAVHNNLESFLVSLLERLMRQRPVQPAAGVDLVLRVGQNSVMPS